MAASAASAKRALRFMSAPFIGRRAQDAVMRACCNACSSSIYVAQRQYSPSVSIRPTTGPIVDASFPRLASLRLTPEFVHTIAEEAQLAAAAKVLPKEWSVDIAGSRATGVFMMTIRGYDVQIGYKLFAPDHVA